ncbi:riboflavin biosynthesis protein RibF [Lacticaseibacillus brantae]|uniref:Riboflavin biosynthesis protein n=1 Tax=Lacticaseibacillus brantae DSM 23927 TaxID=1423727 RepID=A0A0R2B048_9LACO|nr:riboflavin biosynthesis protein RibF [Lacticaseibacillus brantae]KRM72752.1 riboflavin biosynthesis protein RibF [Lacticaseibacillus brantae DSM 23927]
MQVIDIVPPLDSKAIASTPIVLALGFFDGVHRGHQAVINRAYQIAQAKQLPLAVMTFDQHPAIIYRHVAPEDIRYLSDRPRKIELMATFGVDVFYIVHFTPEFAALSPQAFVDQYLVGLHADTVVAGFDYTYGKRDVANMQTLPDYAHGRFDIEVVAEHDAAGEKISSTRIRDALDSGDIDTANGLLGYAYRTTGVVVHGEARGRTLGFPTINIETTRGQRLPGIGIYAVKVLVDGNWWLGMASVGRNVTFGANRPVTVEINLLDFSGDLYGQSVTVQWDHYLRGEVKFTGADALVAQLQQDEQDTRTYYA